jgi:hypothetical protein
MKIITNLQKQKFIKKILYYNNLKKKKISTFNVFLIKSGFISF